MLAEFNLYTQPTIQHGQNRSGHPTIRPQPVINCIRLLRSQKSRFLLFVYALLKAIMRSLFFLSTSSASRKGNMSLSSYLLSILELSVDINNNFRTTVLSNIQLIQYINDHNLIYLIYLSYADRNCHCVN